MPEYSSKPRTLHIYACVCICYACKRCLSMELSVMKIVEVDLIVVWIFYSFDSVFVSSYIYKMFWKLIGLLSSYHNRAVVLLLSLSLSFSSFLLLLSSKMPTFDTLVACQNGATLAPPPLPLLPPTAEAINLMWVGLFFFLERELQGPCIDWYCEKDGSDCQYILVSVIQCFCGPRGNFSRPAWFSDKHILYVLVFQQHICMVLVCATIGSSV